MNPRPDTLARARDRVSPFAHLTGDIAVVGEPGAGTIEESIAQRDSLQIPAADYALLDLRVGSNARGNGRRGIGGKGVVFGGEPGPRSVEESRGLDYVPAGADGAGGVV
jgi:hypothetical protein